MTATIIEDELDGKSIESLDFNHAPMCDGETEDSKCENKADFRCSLKCCGFFFLVCEDCLFGWFEYIKETYGKYSMLKIYCMHCNQKFPKGEDPIKVLGRI